MEELESEQDLEKLRNIKNRTGNEERNGKRRPRETEGNRVEELLEDIEKEKKV